MNPGRRGIRRALGGPLAALVLCLGVAGPVLQRSDLAHGPVVESQHDPATCAPSHDHTLCTQAGANLYVAAGPELLEGHSPGIVPRSADRDRGDGSGRFAVGHPTRAPPIV